MIYLLTSPTTQSPSNPGHSTLTPNDLATLDALAERLLGFGEHYRQIARPFEWTFTRQDLNNLIERIERHEPQPALAA